VSLVMVGEEYGFFLLSESKSMDLIRPRFRCGKGCV
jgi:hypothetical protein